MKSLPNSDIENKVKELNQDYNLEDLKKAFCDGEYLKTCGYNEDYATDIYNTILYSIKRVKVVALEWIDSHDCSSHAECLEDNRGHESDCYTDTSYWSGGEPFSSRELELEIEKLMGYER